MPARRGARRAVARRVPISVAADLVQARARVPSYLAAAARVAFEEVISRVALVQIRGAVSVGREKIPCQLELAMCMRACMLDGPIVGCELLRRGCDARSRTGYSPGGQRQEAGRVRTQSSRSPGPSCVHHRFSHVTRFLESRSARAWHVLEAEGGHGDRERG
jgi:hypothetical protein